MAFFTFGEGYHNYHHAFQYDYRNGVKPASFDPTKWAIWLMSKVGLTSNLLRVPPEKIVLAEMGEARRRAAAHLHQERPAPHHLTDQYKKMMEFLHELSDSLAANCHELEEIISQRAKTSREMLERYRAQTKELLDHVADIGRLKATGAFA